MVDPETRTYQNGLISFHFIVKTMLQYYAEHDQTLSSFDNFIFCRSREKDHYTMTIVE